MVTGGSSVATAVQGAPGGQMGSTPTSIATSVVVATPTTAGDVMATPPRRPGENRRSNKPIMEKRRRARINNCLNELKSLILDAMKKDPARHSKLEKADILEMTVKHLETLQRQQVAMSAATDPSVLNKFRAGFTECAGEVGRFPGLDTPVRRRLMQHLSNCLNGTPTPSSTTSSASETPTQSVQVHILPNPEPNQNPSQGIFFSTNNGGLQLVPTRLPNGDIALVLPSGTTTQFRTNSPAPSSSSNSSSPLPMLIPIPQRTASSASASSTSSCSSPVAFDRLRVCSPVSQRDIGTSPSASYEAPLSPEYQEEYEERAYSPPLQKPLALVMRKRTEEIRSDDEAPWRPW